MFYFLSIQCITTKFVWSVIPAHNHYQEYGYSFQGKHLVGILFMTACFPALLRVFYEPFCFLTCYDRGMEAYAYVHSTQFYFHCLINVIFSIKSPT